MKNFALLLSLSGFLSINALANPLVGKWESECFKVSEEEKEFSLNQNSSEKEILEFSKADDKNIGNVTYSYIYYSDAECKKETSKDEPDTGKYKIGEAKSDVYSLDFDDNVFTIFKVTENKDATTLVFGLETEDLDGSTTEKRPKELESDAIYTKIKP